jgi:hypothetical protein
MDRAVFGVAAAISRYRAGDLSVPELTARVDEWIGSMSEVLEGSLLEEWRSEGNRLEFANASMIDEGRIALTSEEADIVDAALTALEGRCRPWATLNDLERGVLEMLIAGDTPSSKAMRAQLDASRVADRELTGAGFFTELEVDRTAVPAIEDREPFGDVHAEIEGLSYGAGFLLWIRDGYISTLEGYSFEEPWPDVIPGFTLSYTEKSHDLGPSA